MLTFIMILGWALVGLTGLLLVLDTKSHTTLDDVEEDSEHDISDCGE